MLPTTPPPITIDNLVAWLCRLPNLSMSNFWALWDEYFETRPKRRSRNGLISCLARKIQDVALAEYLMELRVARKLARAAHTRKLRRRHPQDRVRETLPDAMKRRATAEAFIGINALIDSYLLFCPDLTFVEAVWLACRVPSPPWAMSGDWHAPPPPDAGLAPSRKPVVPTQAC